VVPLVRSLYEIGQRDGSAIGTVCSNGRPSSVTDARETASDLGSLRPILPAQCRAGHRRNRAAGSGRAGAELGRHVIGPTDDRNAKTCRRPNVFAMVITQTSTPRRFEQPPQGHATEGLQSVVWTAA